MGKNAIVLGASRGVGYKIAMVLAKKGWDVTVVSSNEENLMKAILNAKEEGIELHGEVADVLHEKSVKRLFKKLKQTIQFDLCVNCVGKNLSRMFVHRKGNKITELSFEDWRKSIEINLDTVFLCSREETVVMLEQNHPGVIINISTALRNGGYGQSAYLAAKAGISSLTSSWAIELAKYGIRFGAIAPGAIEGQALWDACEKNEKHALYMEKLKSQIPLKRFAFEEEVADAVCFFAENEYMTGRTIDLDGGGLPARVVY